LITMLLRAISLPMHGALELVVAMAVGVLPIALGLGPAAIAAGVLLGAVMVGLALGASAPAAASAVPAPSLPVHAHAAYDKLLAGVLVAIGAGAALAGDSAALVFAGAGLAYAALIASTRYTRLAR
ncbi:MAG TPA: hypothetical protein VGR10_00135, partial [Thermoleophilaceae bacterium]|nr:hypothetical protein [Thermoleophilaceae bacterium]